MYYKHSTLSSLAKKVLSFLLSEASPMNGMMRTSVVATHAKHTLIAPLRAMRFPFQTNIAEWAGFNTKAT